MNLTRTHTRLLLVVLLPVLVSAPAANASAIEELLEVSGMTEQFHNFPRQMKTGIEAELRQGPVPDVMRGAIVSALDGILEPQAMLDTVGKRLAQELDPASQQRLIRWYKTELGQQFVAAERRAAKPEALERMAAMMNSLAADKERMASARQIDDLVGATKFAMEVTRISQATVITGALSSAGLEADEVTLRAAQLTEQLQGQLMQNEAQFAAMVQASMAFTYREFSAAQIGEYISFLARPEAKTLNHATLAAFAEHWENAAVQLGRNVGAAVKKHANQGVEAATAN